MHKIDICESKTVKSKLKHTFYSMYFKNIDKVLFLSQINYKNAKEAYFRMNERHAFIAWGVDIEFYPVVNKLSNIVDKKYMMSAGNAGRDFDLIIKTFKSIEYNLHIYGTKNKIIKEQLSSNVLFDKDFPYNFTSPKLLLEKYKESYAVLIPLSDCSGLQGITSLLEAMAMGKAVIMTYNKNIDIDIEKEGIGLYVEINDEKGWYDRVNYMLENPKKTYEMGLRGYQLCKDYYNMDRFTQSLKDQIKSII